MAHPSRGLAQSSLPHPPCSVSLPPPSPLIHHGQPLPFWIPAAWTVKLDCSLTRGYARATRTIQIGDQGWEVLWHNLPHASARPGLQRHTYLNARYGTYISFRLPASVASFSTSPGSLPHCISFSFHVWAELPPISFGGAGMYSESRRQDDLEYATPSLPTYTKEQPSHYRLVPLQVFLRRRFPDLPRP